MVGVRTFIFANLFVLTASDEINYCGSKMCGYTNAHTFCQFSSGRSPDCTGYIPAPLQQEEKSRVLARLNRRRDEAASGKLRGLPSAGNMLKLRWVGELAREAQLWADQCRPPQVPEEHDACRDLYSISVGQCVASVVGEAPGLRVESMVDIWYMQSMYYKGNVTLYEPPESRKRFYGDFAQMMWARVYMVGCGRSRFMISIRGRFRTVERLVCNFAPLGPPLYRPLWIPGVPATTCPSRSHPYDVSSSSLCDYQRELNQQKDKKNDMTMEEQVLLNTVLEMELNGTQYKRSLDEIYLTNLAIVTMQNSNAKTPYSNSIQKRDIVEKIGLEEGNITVKLAHIQKILNGTTGLQTILNKLKKKLKFIGRPKTYNIEDLSDIGDQADEYHDTTEGISKDKKIFYEEFNIYTTEENKTDTNEHIEKDLHALTYNTVDNNDIEKQFVPVPSTLVEKNATFDNYNYAVMLAERVSTIATPDRTHFDTIKKEEIVEKRVETISKTSPTIYNDSLAAADKIIDDYLSDPETVRVLQEALDLTQPQSNTSMSSGKARRDLNNVPSDQLNGVETTVVSDNVAIVSGSEIPATESPEEERNRTLERAPMLNMVMKYMPYLKSYENEILGTESLANCHLPSLLMISSVSLVLLCDIFL